MAGLEDARPALAGAEARGVDCNGDSAMVVDLARCGPSVACNVKRWRTAQARALLAGFRADLIDDDRGRPVLVVSRWALTRSFESIDQAESWVEMVAPAAEGAAP